MSDLPPPSVAPPRWVRGLKIAGLLVILLLLHFFGSWLEQLVNLELFPRHDAMLNLMVLVAIGLYVLLMAIPFMPGIEIGLALMMLLGAKGALVVYLSTLLALSISFIVGRTLPPALVIRFLNWLHLERASALVRQLEPLNQRQRLDVLSEKLPARIAPLLLTYRYLIIAVVLNLPGNALIGGGGGIGLIVGMSKIIPLYAFVALLAVVVAPVPLWFYLYGG